MSSILPAPAAESAPRTAPTRNDSALRKLLRVMAWLVGTAWSLLLLAWLTLHWGILPRIEQWRAPIEARASAALGVPVRIGGIVVQSSGWVPSIELRDVVLLDAQQREALRLPRVMAAVSPRSLLQLELRFAQLLIEGAELEVRRDAAGRIFVAGLDFSTPGAADEGAAADWFFAQPEFVIRGGTLRWVDESRGAEPLALTDVQLLVRNGLRRHDIRLDATPQAGWGDRFSLNARFTQPLLARRGDWKRWSGTAYADLPRADVRQLSRHVSLPFQLNEGDGSLRGWFELKNGQPVGATVDLALRAVALRLGASVEPMSFEQVQGRVVGLRDERGFSIALQGFGFVTGDGIRWPQGDLKLALRQAEGQPVAGGEFSADRLDVGLMARVAGRVPLGDAVRKLLAELKPQGVIGALNARWDGALDAPTRYQVKGLLSGASLAARPAAEAGGIGRPGLRNATLQLEASESGGKAQLGIAGGALEFPGVFEEPVLPFDQLSAQLAWSIAPGAAGAPSRIGVTVKGASFANADAQGELDANWTTGAGEGFARGGRLPGTLELNGKIAKGAAARVARYLPLGIPDSARHYVARAVRGGTVSGATFRVKGDLWDFPFVGSRVTKDGEFRIAGKVDDVAFAYVPSAPATATEPAFVSPWPGFTRVSGELVIDRASLEIRNASARLGGVELTKVQGGIANLIDKPVLAMDGNARGPLAEMVGFVNATPVGGWIGKALAQASTGGNAELRLALALPLADLEASTVNGSVTLAGNDVRITPDTPLLAGARGRVDFTHKGVAVVGASARVFGGDASFDGGSQSDGSLRFNGQGSVSAEGLRRANAELGLIARAAGALTGQAAYRLNLGFVHGLPELMITSNLVGMAIDLPAPLRKAAEVPLALRVQTTLAPDSLAAGQTPRDTLRVELGSVVQAQYVRDLSGAAPRVLRGGIGVQDTMPEPPAGVAANVNLQTLRADAWEAAVERLLGGPATTEGSGAGGYGPGSIALRVAQLEFGARQVRRLVAGLTQDDGTWRANIDSEQTSGYLEYRPARRGTAGRVYARLARLSLPKSDAEQVQTLLDQQPGTVPALDIVVDDFELRGRRLGRLEIEAQNRAAGEPRSDAARESPRDWRLSRFILASPDATLSATGAWAAPSPVPGGGPPRRRALMAFRLDVSNAGLLLERLGAGRAVKGGKGLLTGNVEWIGSPLDLDFATMTGNVNVAIDAGQFLKAEPGAARFLSVLSLQSLPRRLALDFRDVFQEGFAFDAITGDLRIRQGVASTNNLRMRGVQAAVLMEGSADIARETQDLRVVVVPEINAGTASLAYSVINPAVGLGTFLAQVFLRKPLIAAGTREFRVTGPWADPKVEKVERKPGDPIPDMDAPTAAPAPGQ